MPITNPYPGVFTNGDHTVPFQVGPLIWERPFKLDSKVYIYHMVMRQFINKWKPLPIGSAGPQGGTLVDETPVKSLDGTLLGEWTRTFALVPNSRNEYEGFVYSFQDTITTTNSETGDSTQSILEIPLALTTRVQYDYFYRPNATLVGVANPYSIPIIAGQHFFQAGPVVDYYGVAPGDCPILSVQAGVELVAEDSVIKQWMGYIFERKTRFVPNENPVT